MSINKQDTMKTALFVWQGLRKFHTLVLALQSFASAF